MILGERCRPTISVSKVVFALPTFCIKPWIILIMINDTPSSDLDNRCSTLDSNCHREIRGIRHGDTRFFLVVLCLTLKSLRSATQGLTQMKLLERFLRDDHIQLETLKGREATTSSRGLRWFVGCTNDSDRSQCRKVDVSLPMKLSTFSHRYTEKNLV